MNLVFLGSVLVCVAVASAANIEAAPLGARQSMAVDGVIQERVGPMPGCASNFGGTITGQGDSATLGRVVFIATDCITPSGALFDFQKGRLVLVTVGGDQIFANYSGQFVPTGNGTNYVFSSATYQITGGRGRFLLATGGGTLTGGEDMATSLGTLKLEGTLSYPASVLCPAPGNTQGWPVIRLPSC